MTNVTDQPQRHRRTRDVCKWAQERFEYAEFDEFLNATILPAGLHSISDNGEIIDFLFVDNNSDGLAVLFHGAVQAAKIPKLKLPIFSGLNVELGYEADRLLFSD
ncbi:MAG: hypothetical protein ACK46Q_05575, partial [Hyphomonas sp.]